VAAAVSEQYRRGFFSRIAEVGRGIASGLAWMVGGEPISIRFSDDE